VERVRRVRGGVQRRREPRYHLSHRQIVPDCAADPARLLFTGIGPGPQSAELSLRQ
jgi:hypothetical protein